jgi:acyl dehydratase
MGHQLEHLVPGFSVTTAVRTIVEADVRQFAELTGDFNALHLDNEYAKGSPFGERIVHGALVFGISIGLAMQADVVGDASIAFSRVDHLRFSHPVFVDDAVVVTKTVLTIQPAGEARLVTFDTRVRNQHGHVVLAYVDKLLMRKRPVVSPTAAAAVASGSSPAIVPTSPV